MKVVSLLGVLQCATGFVHVMPTLKVTQQERRLRSQQQEVEVKQAAPAKTEEASPPESMGQCLLQAYAAVGQALDDKVPLMEIEFPPLPTDVLESAETSASDLARANTDLAVNLAKNLANKRNLKVGIMYPDTAEMDRAIEDFGTDEPVAGVTFHALRRGWITASSPEQMFWAFFGKGEDVVQEINDVDLYICLTFSAQELPDLETLNKKDPTKPLIMFNLKLETQRGDLGLPAFPPKDLQWRFLSRVKPVYYLRTRAYSLSMPTPPFVVNYQGAIFRQYPGQFQSLLDTGGAYRPVAQDPIRPALGTFKRQLTAALKIEDTEAKRFARTGYKAITWWEEDKENLEESKEWRL